MTRARANNSIEPTEDEAASFTTVDQVAAWAALGVSQAADGPRQPDPVRDSLYALFGLEGSTHVRVLALIPEVDFEDTLSDWKIPRTSQPARSSEGEPSVEAEAGVPTHAQRAQAGLFGRAARIACGTQRRFSEVNANADLLLRTQAAAKSVNSIANDKSSASDPSRKVKLSQVVDQTSEVEVETLTQADISAAYARYNDRLGGEPPPDQEPSMDQLSALHHLVYKAMLPPDVDFALYAPHQVRYIRRLKFSGLVLNGAGQLMRGEMVGPSGYRQWEACFNVFRTACIMLNIASPASLDIYRDHIKRYVQRYTEACWPLIYQADTRARKELSERIRRRMRQYDSDSSATVYIEGNPYESARPWDYVFRRMTLEFDFWKSMVEDSALLIMSRSMSLGASLTGEAPTASQQTDHVAGPVFHEFHPQNSSQSSGSAAPKRQAARSRSVRLPPNLRNYNTDSAGRHTANRQGRALCSDFQSGKCTGHTCSVDSSLAHQCAICLDNKHGANRCAQNPGHKGKGKGKGGKGGKNKSYHG